MHRLTDVLELAGLLFVVAAAGLAAAQYIGLWPALLIVGVLLVAISWALVRISGRAAR